jgi:hypothetical protein
MLQMRFPAYLPGGNRALPLRKPASDAADSYLREGRTRMACLLSGR